MTRPWDAARIAEVRARCEAATPGPWQADPDDAIIKSGDLRVAAAMIGGKEAPRRLAGEDNARLIAAARTDLPEALDEIERLRGIIASLPDPWRGAP